MAQLASASGLGPEGPVFESQYPDIQQKPAENQQVFSFYAEGTWIQKVENLRSEDSPQYSQHDFTAWALSNA